MLTWKHEEDPAERELPVWMRVMPLRVTPDGTTDRPTVLSPTSPLILSERVIRSIGRSLHGTGLASAPRMEAGSDHDSDELLSSVLAALPEVACAPYDCRNPEVLSRVLGQYPSLCGILQLAYTAIARHFGSHPSVVLDLVSDPEADDDRTLFAYVRTDLPPAEALARLEAIDDALGVDPTKGDPFPFCVSVEFQ